MKEIKVRRAAELIVGVAIVAALFMAFSWSSSQAALVTRTWDGGGATNNWSEPANWVGDITPLASDDVVFNGTSTKDVFINGAVTVRSLTIEAGYTGTFSQPGFGAFTIDNGTSSMAGGTFICSGGVHFRNTNFTQTGGTFNCAAGTMTMSSVNLIVTGGTFTAPNGTMTLGATSAIETGSSGTFTSNGTIVANGDFAIFRIVNGSAATLDLNNLTIDLANPTGAVTLNEPNDKLRVLGTLTLARGDTQGIFEAHGPVSVLSTYGNVNQSGKLVLAGSATRTITLATLAPGLSYPRLEINAPNTTVKSTGTGPIRIKSFDLISGTVETEAMSFVFGTGDSFSPSSQSGGLINCGNSVLTFSAVDFTQTGGTFDCEAGTIDSNFVILRLHGGTFEAPAGSMTLQTPAPGGTVVERGPSVFNHNNGTVVLLGGAAQFRAVNGGPAELDLGNLTVNLNNTLAPTGNFKLRVNGNLNHSSGVIFQGTTEVHGNVTIGSGVIANGNSTNMVFAGANNQSFTNNGGSNSQGNWTIDKTGGTVTLQSPMNLADGFGTFNLNQGTITTGTHVVDVGSRGITRSSGHVIGNLQRRFTTLGTKVFDVGTANGYAPVTVNATQLGLNPSDLTVGSKQGTHPVLNPSVSLGRYWPITESGNITATLTFNYLDVDVNGSENLYKVNRIENGQIEVLDPPTATIDTATNTATVTGVTNFSDWTLSGTAPPLVLDPLNPTVNAGGSIAFNASGGTPPYTFSIPTNNSGGKINASTGIYFAGATFGVQDTVQVTDSSNQSLTTNVSVTDPFLVVNTNDSGVGSLRQAIINANSAADGQTIRFNIPGTPPFTIAPVSPLPVMTGPTEIDGTSQPGYAGAPVIELNGTNANGNGLEIANVIVAVIRGLAINRFSGNGILVTNSSQVAIRGNYVGVGLDGVTPRGNGSNGVVLTNSSSIMIGGSTPLLRNVISANGFDGVSIAGSNQVSLIGNYIGVGADGTSPAGNGRTGVHIIGGNSVNVGSAGLPDANIVAFTGTVNPPATPEGGIVIEGVGGGHNVGINSIHSNVGLGIDLSPAGVTPNDNCDVDTGPNSLQNFPVLTAASTSASGTVISGSLNSTTNRSYRLSFYSSPQADPSGHGEGRTFIGSVLPSIGAGCEVTYDQTFPDVSLPPGSFVTAIAQSADGTSEFSPAIPVTAACNYSINPTSQNFNANGGNGTFSVNTDTGCPWSAVASDPFITIVSSPNGSGTGTVNFTVAANATGVPRSGTITVGGQTFSITQSAECVYSISPTSQNFGDAGGIGTIHVEAPAGCAWTAVSNSGFVTIKTGGSGSGPGDVSYSVASFAGGSRSGTITVAGKSFTISQSSNLLACNTSSFRMTNQSLGLGGANLISAADFNRDGIFDLVLYRSFPSPQLFAALGKGDGTFFDPIATDLPNTVIVGVSEPDDLNSDGLPDIVVKVQDSTSGQRELRIGLSNGFGRFDFSDAHPTTSALSADFVTADFTGDGKHDLVAGTGTSQNQLFVGNGDGTFADPISGNASLSTPVKVADLNRDGKPDLITPRSTGLAVLIGAGGGTFNVGALLPGTNIFRYTIDDFTRDGKLDIAASDATSPNVSTIKVFAGTGTGTFAPPIQLAPINGAAILNAADINRDGKLDLITSAPSIGISVFLGTGTGGFSSGGSQSLNPGAGLAVGDFNGDGKQDIAVPLPPSHTAVLLNTCGGLTQKPKIDFDGDGRSDVAIWRPSTGEWYVLRSSDGSYFSFQFGLAGDLPAAADFDGDNKTDAAVFRPSTGQWFVLRSTDGGATIFVFGTNGDRPAPGDYDGDGKTDFAVFRPSDGNWWVRRSSDNAVTVVQWGIGSDVIVQ